MSGIVSGEVESVKRGVVTVKACEARRGVNRFYQNPNRVQSYAATQKFVVDKDDFYREIIDVLVNGIEPIDGSIRIFEPGIGPAAFTRFVLQKPFVDRFDKIDIEGADISHTMITYAAELINRLYQSNGNGNRVDATLTSGANCINPTDPFYQAIRSKNKLFDAIVASQFEHYCPNSSESELACRYRESGIPFSTKQEFRQFCYSLLVEGGIYFTVDDRLGETPEEHEMICYAWDSHVVSQFADDTVLQQIDCMNPLLARNIRLTYDPEREKDALINVAAKAREYRRRISGEEIEPLSKTRQDFIHMFGEENVYCMMHPSARTHPGFYLMWGIKRA